LIADYVFVFNIAAFLSGIEGHRDFALPGWILAFLSRQLVGLGGVPASKLRLVADRDNVLTWFGVCVVDLELDLHLLINNINYISMFIFILFNIFIL
jgi:hypothetical protein